MRVGIVNVTGYAGAEIARLLHVHPNVRLTSVTGRSAAGQRLGQVFPHLDELGLTVEAELADVDVAFLALPHAASAEVTPGLLSRGLRVIDMGADFRLRDAKIYEQWYKHTHPCPDLLDEAVYGLVELNRAKISKARVVANPGCYPTGAILALTPAVRNSLIGPDIIVDSKSGTSGAGRTLRTDLHFSEASDSVTAYGLGGHRHLPEIAQELEVARAKSGAAEPLAITFVPHLIPMTRGILTTAYAFLKDRSVGTEEIRSAYRAFYQGERFVKVVDNPPSTKQTWGSNYCYIYPTVDARTGRLVVVSCLDNLVKGAAGQAVQSMNLVLGLPEYSGLEALGVYP